MTDQKALEAARRIVEAEKLRGTGAFFEAVEQNALTVATALLSHAAQGERGKCPVGKQCHPADPHCIYPTCQPDASVARSLATRGKGEP